MYKWLILLLAASVLLLVSSSLAQLEWTWSLPDPIDSGTIFDSSGAIISTGDWQTMTGLPAIPEGVDSGGVITSWLDFTGLLAITEGNDDPSLSGEIPPVLESWEITGETNSWIISDPIPHLILSEVYYDGTDERIEITNIGDGNFQGNFTLVGVKSTSLSLANISLISGESKIFGDNLSQVSGNRFIGKTGLSLNLIDTVAINIQLLISGQMEDNFLVDQYRVNQYNNKKTSFEKISWISTRVQTGRVVNAQSGIVVNPGVYFRTGNFTNVSFPLVQSWDNLQLPVPCVSVDQRDLIKINEIFPGNEKYPPYIELAIHSDISLNSLSISGNRLATGLEFSRGSTGTTLQKNSYLLISSSGFRSDEGLQSVRNSDFSLVNTWNRLLITIGSWQSRRVMDITYLSGDTLGSSSYFVNATIQCARVLDSLDYFSPGFERKFLKYFSGVTLTKIEYITVTTGNTSGTGTCPSSWQTDPFSWDTQVITDISWILQQYTIHILNIDYDPEGSDTNNEKITLLATNISGDQTPLDLSKIFRLKVNGTNKTLPRILPMNVPTTFVKTFGFPNSTDNGQEVIVQLTYGDYVFDTYTYNPNILSEQTITGDVESTWTLFDLSGLQFSITYVLPNPKGKDITEEIGIKVDSQNSIMTGINLSDEWYLKISTKKKKLKWNLEINKENILSGSLGLVNKAACVSLIYNEQELTKFCYRKPKEWEKIYASNQWLEETPQENLDILNTLQLKRNGNQLCVYYKDQSFLCKRIPASKAEIKTTQEQKLYKWFASLMKQYVINNRKSLYYDTPLKEYFDRVALDKKLIAQWITHVDIYGQSVLATDLKQQLQILETTLPSIIALFEWINWL